MNIQLHKESGLSIRDSQSKEILYQASFDSALADAELEQITWPDENLMRIFTLTDGRIAMVRETANGLSQEMASPDVQALYQAIADKADTLIEKEASRKALEASSDTSISDEA